MMTQIHELKTTPSPAEKWKKSFDDPSHFDTENFIFVVSGFRSQELFKHPASLVDPYWRDLYASMIGKGGEIQPDRNGQRWRLKTFRPWGAIIRFDPRLIAELRDHDPGPPEMEDPTPSLRWSDTTPEEVLNSTELYNEMRLGLLQSIATEIIGFFCTESELDSNEGKQLQEHANKMNLPLIVLNEQTGVVRRL